MLCLCQCAPTEAGWPSERQASFPVKRALNCRFDAVLSFSHLIPDASSRFILYSMRHIYIRTSAMSKWRASLDKPMFVFCCGDVVLTELSDRMRARSYVLAHVLNLCDQTQ